MLSRSPGRGRRVVAEIERTKFSCLRSWSQIVVLPTPAGPETMTMRPPRMLTRSLDVRDLLAHLLDLELDLEDAGDERGVVALGRHGVRLAEQLLREELELAADGLAVRVERGAELRDVAAEALELLRDVRAVREERELAREVGLGERDVRALEELLDAGAELLALILDRRLDATLDGLSELEDPRGERLEVGRDPAPLLAAHLEELLERLVERRAEPLPEGVEVVLHRL